MNRRDFLTALAAATAAAAIPGSALPNGWAMEGEWLTLRGKNLRLDAPLDIPIGPKVRIVDCRIHLERGCNYVVYLSEKSQVEHIEITQCQVSTDLTT